MPEGSILVGPNHPSQTSQKAPQLFVRSDEHAAGAFCHGDVQHVANRVIVVASRQVPRAVQIAQVIDEPDRQDPEPLIGAVRLGTAPALAPDSREEGI